MTSPFFWTTALRHAVAEREPRMLGEVPRLAVDRNDDLGPHPIVHFDQLGAARDGPRRGRGPGAR